ncbi:MAG: cobalamin biosynthesis protein [Rhodothalassiaceae bacterium]
MAVEAPNLASLSPILILLMAMGLNLLLGRESVLKRTFDIPIGMTGRFLSGLQQRYNRPEYTDRMRKSDGISSLSALILLALILGLALEWAFNQLPYGWAPEALVVAAALVLRSHFDGARVLASTLDLGTEQGRATLALFAARDTARLDRPGVCRAGIEITARTLCEGVIHPVIFYLLFGLPGLLVVRAISVFSRAIDEYTPYGTCFGWASGRVNRALQWPAMLITPLIVALASLVTPGAAPLSAVQVALRDWRKHAVARDGWAFGSFAGALRVKLGGPIAYYGQLRNTRWIGDGLGEADVAQLRKARRVFIMSTMVIALLVGALILVEGQMPLVTGLIF